MGDKVPVKELDLPSQELIWREFNQKVQYGRFGEVGCLSLMTYKEHADNYKNMTIRPDDIWVATFPRSGTTWTQELVWLIQNDFNFETASKIPLTTRFMFLESRYAFYIDPSKQEFIMNNDPSLLKEMDVVTPSYDAVASAPSPRFIKTHLHFSLLPSNLLDTAKVVYVARDPRDVAVSYYNHTKLFGNYTGDFKSYWNLFINDLVIWSPFFPHLKEAWALRHHPNLLFLFYEDMSKDLPAVVKKVANFLGKEVTDEEMMKLCEHLNIKNFKKNESVNFEPLVRKIGNPDAESFVRKGKAGAWREHFDEEMAAQAQRWISDNLAGTDLRFPDYSSNVANLISLYSKG